VLCGGFELGEGYDGDDGGSVFLGFRGRGRGWGCGENGLDGREEGHGVVGPINRWVPFFEPGEAKDNVMVWKGDDPEIQMFMVVRKLQISSNQSFIAMIQRAIGKSYRYR
jgi:hypothetical protein